MTEQGRRLVPFYSLWCSAPEPRALNAVPFAYDPLIIFKSESGVPILSGLL